MELRWVLLALGLLVILGVYLWGKGVFRRPERTAKPRVRTEPKLEPGEEPESVDIGDEDVPLVVEPSTPASRGFETTVIERKPSPRRLPEKVVAIRVIPRHEHPTAEAAVLAMRKLGLEHGMYGIFHRIANGDTQNPVFSVARLTEPGTFDLTKLSETKIPGLSMFMTLPGAGDPVVRFDAMVEAARSLARELNAELYDEKGSSWSFQRERFLREEMIEYRHHLDHG